MKRICPYLLRFIICTSFLSVLLYPYAALSATCEQWVAKVVSVQGTVEVQRVGETAWKPAKLNDTLCPGDTIQAHKRSRANLALINQSVLRLNQKTTLTLGEFKKEKETSVLDLLKGAGHFLSRQPRALEVRTPFAIAGVRGTEFFIRVEEDQTFMSIFEGKVLASNEVGELMLASGQAAVAEKGKAPVLRVVVRPRDAVHWALYYPPVMYVPPEKAPVKEDTNDPRFLAHQASLLIPVGRVDEAGKDLERALTLDPNYSDAFALQSIIAVVQNEKEKALNLAEKAVETGPNSATARIALSYAKQASFDLEGARASLEEAVKLEPENALAWARLAELWSAFGYLDKSLEAAQKAVALSSNLSRTQTVLGFAYLTQVKTTEAKDAFTKAIELDQADPLPRLGLGLAKIREGDLKEGGREIEVAASLDPNNSLVRSYMGKVYFEEKRTDLDVREYAIAKELDPKDPTPWFYDAIGKQTTNRPVEALHDLQKAIELNDNRAVYRSKLSLDSDLAARSASQARIYSDLGFQQRALVEGWNSVNTDPTNYSAHRFLADSYSALPRHEIARVSELLQSQLLQPTNITPIQPRLAESNLLLISAGGPADLSFNEFNPLFNRDRVAVQGSGIVGENDTWGGEGVVSGIYKKVSYSIGGTHFETDGWRENADQDDDIANAFVQLEVSHKTSIQAEYRYRDTEKGDVQLRFFQDNFFPNERNEEETDSFRLGFRHNFSPDSIIMGNFQRQDLDGALRDEIPEFFVSIDSQTDLKGYGGELQHMFRSHYFNITSGIGYFDIDGERVDIVEWGGFPFPTDTSTLDTDHTNLYLYSHICLPKNVTLSIGGSADFLDTKSSNTEDKDQFNPKFGVTWSPVPATTIRGAVFRTLKRKLITDQTLEPTQIAGFNQFYDDADSTEAWRYGVAIDHKFSKAIYGGAEFSKRDLEVPFQDFLTGNVERVDWEEYLGRSYLYWTPHEWLACSAEYLYERFERDEEFTYGAKEIKTHRVPLGIKFFHPFGFSAMVKATYFDQEGDFEKIEAPGFFSDEDQFWVVDASFSYRLPKRNGFITIGATNLFDEEFEYFDTDFRNPIIQPERVVFARLTLAF